MVYNGRSKRDPSPRTVELVMRRSAALAVFVLSICLAAQVQAADRTDHADRDARRAERMAMRVEQMLTPLFGKLESGRAQFRAHGGGIYSLGYPLDAFPSRGFRAELADDEDDTPDKKLQLLASGHMLVEPLDVATLVNAVVADNTALYNFWWATVNLTNKEIVRKTILTVTGPDEYLLEVSEDEFPYGPATLWVFWYAPEEPLGGVGIYTHKTVVKKAGKSVYSFIAEDPPPPEEDEEEEPPS